MSYRHNFLVVFFLGGGGGGGRGGGGGEHRQKKKETIGIRILFCHHALYKISSSWLKWFPIFNIN